MQAQIILEWKLFTRQIKNQVVFFLFLFISLYAAFVIEPNFIPWRPIDAEIYEAEIEDATYFLTHNEEYLNPRMYEMFSRMIDHNTQLLQSIEDEDWQAVVEEEDFHYLNFVNLRYGDAGVFRDPYFYNYDEASYLSEIHQSYAEGVTANRYINYQKSDTQLSKEVIEERTAVQAILRYLQNWLPAILIILAILYAVDIFPKDKNHLSVVKTVPLSQYKNSWAKTLVVMGAYLFTLFIGFLLFTIPVSFQQGFGSLNIPIPIYGWSYSNGDIWVSTTVGVMLLQALLILVLIVLIFIRAMTYLNIFLKKNFLNLLFIPFVFVSNLWHTPGKTYVHAQYNYIPATYFRIGEALSGQLNYLYLSNLISFGTGFVVLTATFLLIECLNFVTLKLKYRLRRRMT